MTLRLGVLLSLVVGACTTTDGGKRPVVLDDFDTGGCKSSEQLAASALTQKDGAGTTGYDAAHDGLQCFVWKRLSEEKLSIEITNHADGCGAEMSWEPRAELDEQGGLDLLLENKQCTFAACGSCIYDLTFEVKVPRDTKQLRTRLLGDDCDGERSLHHEQTLPLDTQPSGVLCVDYRPRPFREPECGQSIPPFAHCDDNACDPATAVPCAAGTECVEVENDALRCLPTCDSDADCSPYPSTHCEKSVCVL